MIEQLKAMLLMQRLLDDNIEKTHDVVITVEGLKTAMIDEIGELTHELKGKWCWWKKTQAPVNKEKVLEELVDVIHFALSIHNHCGYDIPNFNFEYINELVTTRDYSAVIRILLKGDKNILSELLLLTYKLDFTFDDVYEAYKKKNEENWNRLKRGY